MITVYQGKNGRLLIAIGPDMGIMVSTDSNGVGLLEGPETAMEDLAKAIMTTQEGYAATQGRAIQTGIYQTPPEVQQKIETDILPAALAPSRPEKPPQSEEATTRKSRSVQNSPKVPLTKGQKNKILEMHAANWSYDEIKGALSIDGRRVVGVIRGQEQRGRMAAMAATPQSLPGVEGAPEAARAHPRGTPEEAPHAKPNPKLDYHEVADTKILNMKKRGMLDHEIATVLERNPGGHWTSQGVAARYTELKRQGLIFSSAKPPAPSCRSP
jgi:hypothetical protein